MDVWLCERYHAKRSQHEVDEIVVLPPGLALKRLERSVHCFVHSVAGLSHSSAAEFEWCSASVLLSSNLCPGGGGTTADADCWASTHMKTRSTVVLLFASLALPSEAAWFEDESISSCPGSPAWVYAWAQIAVESSVGCAEAKAEIQARVAGSQSGTWQDPHNGKFLTLPSSH